MYEEPEVTLMHGAGHHETGNTRTGNLKDLLSGMHLPTGGSRRRRRRTKRNRMTNKNKNKNMNMNKNKNKNKNKSKRRRR